MAPKYKKAAKKKKTGIVRPYNVVPTPLRLFKGSAMPTNLIYHQSGQLNPGAVGVIAGTVFRLGSIFDPDLTGVGHQPLGHDQLAALFERYQVWKVDFDLVMVNLDTSNENRAGCTISDDNSIAVSTGEELIEQGNSRWDVLGIASSSGSKKRFTGSVLNCDVHNISYKQYMANDDYGANFGSNPAEDAFLKVWADGFDTDTGAVRYAITLVYHTKCMGSVTTSQS